MNLRLKDSIRITFNNDVLDVYNNDRHEISQPFHSDTGEKFQSQEEAMSWLVTYYPDYFIP